jgi:hypothetical protein
MIWNTISITSVSPTMMALPVVPSPQELRELIELREVVERRVSPLVVELPPVEAIARSNGTV